MAGRGGFQAITPGDVSRLLALPRMELWDFASSETAAVFVARMDKAWVAIHRCLSDGTLFGCMDDPPLDMAVLGEHLICQTDHYDFVYLKPPPEVADIAKELARMSVQEFEELLAALPEPDEDMVALNLHLVTNHPDYVVPYFEEMREFYQRAAKEGLAVLFEFG